MYSLVGDVLDALAEILLLLDKLREKLLLLKLEVLTSMSDDGDDRLLALEDVDWLVMLLLSPGVLDSMSSQPHARGKLPKLVPIHRRRVSWQNASSPTSSVGRFTSWLPYLIWIVAAREDIRMIHH